MFDYTQLCHADCLCQRKKFLSPASELGKDETFDKGSLWAVLEIQSPGWLTQFPVILWICGIVYFQEFWIFWIEGF